MPSTNWPQAKSFPSDVTVEDPVPLAAFDAHDGTAPGPGDPWTKAIFVAHGMGQQVKFETVETVARALEPWWEPQPGAEPKKVVVREVQVGEQRIHRAEIRLRRPEGKPGEPAFVDVHLYEAYWANLTEGKVALGDVFGFLWDAAWNGVKNARGAFARWEFDHVVSYPIREGRTIEKLVLALLVIASLQAIQALAGVTSVTALLLRQVHWPSAALLSALPRIVGAVLAPAVVAGIAIVLLHRRHGRGAAPLRPPAAVVGIAWGFAWLTIAALVVAAVFGLWTLLSASGGALADEQSRWLAGGSWLLLFVLWWRLRYFLIQYVGDVAVYLSGHRVSKFNDIRQAIKETALAAGRAVYGAVAPGASRFAYGGVIVVGHSLGSVIAYDTLNALMRDDAFSGGKLRVAPRTELLLTLGSPLNKTAFIFRSQLGKDSEIREAMAASVQPMIQSYRRPEWVNIYSRNDWISGPIQYYDDVAANPDAARPVANEEDKSATTPLAAHVEYWRGHLFAQTLWATLVS
ncbi:MAG: hypothetical protein U0167_06770 [bacterium]